MKANIKIVFLGFIIVLLTFSIVKVSKSSATKNLTDVQAIYSLPSNQLIAAYLNDQKEFEKKYVGKILEVEGVIEEINNINGTITIILRTKLEDYSVICDMNQQYYNTKNRIRIGEKVTIKGVCKGILKDVILLNCVLI